MALTPLAALTLTSGTATSTTEVLTTALVTGMGTALALLPVPSLNLSVILPFNLSM